MSSDSVSGIGVTAVLVADARARESSRGDHLFVDVLAEAFVEAAIRTSPTIADAVTHDSPSEIINQVRRDSVAVRTRFYDEYVLAAVRAGCLQIVLVAAGFDARAFRLPWPTGVRVWELDAPDVLTLKDRVLGERSARPRCERTSVPLDLREDWPARLSTAGMDSRRPTAWLLEGILMYLDEGERDRLLDRVTRLSAPGSRMALDHASGFFSPPMITSPEDPIGDRTAARFNKLAEAAVSDPSLTAPSKWLSLHGWEATVDDRAVLFARYGRGVPEAMTSSRGPRSWIATAKRAEPA